MTDLVPVDDPVFWKNRAKHLEKLNREQQRQLIQARTALEKIRDDLTTHLRTIGGR